MFQTSSSSESFVGSLWNLIQCFIVLFLNYWSEQAIFFNVQYCTCLYLVNLVVCFVYFKVSSEETNILSTKCALILPLAFHIISVLFGAPYVDNWDGTFSFAMLVTSLILPTVATNTSLSGKDIEFSRLKWVRTDELCTLGGAWISALSIPLDWDRPWQVWPVPCCMGAIGGCALISSYRFISAAYRLVHLNRPRSTICLYKNSVSEIKKR